MMVIYLNVLIKYSENFNDVGYKTGTIHTAFGKASFDKDKLYENLKALLEVIQKKLVLIVSKVNILKLSYH